MKYIKKPDYIEAELFHIDGHIPEGVYIFTISDSKGNIIEKGAFVKTFIGRKECLNGDYIVTESDGNKYPWKASEFESIYDKAEE